MSLQFIQPENSTLLNIKGANLNQFLELNNILLFFTFQMYIKIYYFNTTYNKTYN